MRRHVCGMLGLLIASACISVPPEEEPPYSTLKATATVDKNGRTIEGGNLVIEIPAGALDDNERITVTIEAISNTPAQHLSEAYLVKPEGQIFNQAVKIIYKYDAYLRDHTIDPAALFIGFAVGSSWQQLDSPDRDQAAMRVWGRVNHFSVFGLVDPNAPVDGGVIFDAGGTDRAGHDAAVRDRAGVDTRRPDSATPNNEIQVELTWTGATSDFDLHLLRTESAEFTDDDCYYQNCKPVLPGMPALDWPPTGVTGGDPLMDIDDMDGSGPENIVLAEPGNETYVAAVHLYKPNTDTLPISYTVKIFWRGSLVRTVTRDMAACGNFVDVANIAVSNNGNSVSTSERSDPATARTDVASCQ